MVANLIADRRVATPLVKWAGGKQAAATDLVERFPSSIRCYFEPFVGGASVFFALRPRRAVISDANQWLVDTYLAVRDSPGAVARLLERLPNTRERFLRVRAMKPERLTPALRAAHFIYLNKTCFRGLYRVNRAGQFNVPYGAYQRRYFDEENLHTASERLSEAEIRSGDFELGLDGIQEGDFAYLDPPYYKAGGYSDFNRYTPLQFREKDHFRLAAVCRELDTRGVRWAMTNSDTAFIRALFCGYNIDVTSARREINLHSTKRNVTELFISNY